MAPVSPFLFFCPLGVNGPTPSSRDDGGGVGPVLFGGCVQGYPRLSFSLFIAIRGTHDATPRKCRRPTKRRATLKTPPRHPTSNSGRRPPRPRTRDGARHVPRRGGTTPRGAASGAAQTCGRSRSEWVGVGRERERRRQGRGGGACPCLSTPPPTPPSIDAFPRVGRHLLPLALPARLPVRRGPAPPPAAQNMDPARRQLGRVWRRGGRPHHGERDGRERARAHPVPQAVAQRGGQLDAHFSDELVGGQVSGGGTSG